MSHTPSPMAYQDYYVPHPQHPLHHPHSSYSQSITLHHPHEHPMAHHLQQPPPSPPIPIDPALALYQPQYYPYQQPHHQMPPPHLTLSASLSSPSSHGSETVGTPPNDTISFSSNANGKRPASSNSVSNDSRKRARQDDDADPQSPTTERGDEPKAKPTRGSRACTVCRRLKMKCVGAENGPPCKRCQTGNHECIFEESNRGKRSTKKHEILTRSLRKMERTLDTVLRSLGNPSLASGMLSRSPSPTLQTQNTQALMNSPSPPPSPGRRQHSSHIMPTSPKMHSLPDNSLNPLGLLAEASLANRRAQAAAKSSSTPESAADKAKLGVASDVYFKPGPMTILPLRRLYIERQVQPEMLSFVSTEEVVALFQIYFDHMNVHSPLLDPEFHTPSLVCSRSPFLLTSICAVASRFYDARPDLHLKLSDLARKLAFQVPARGYKSVEIVQAYLINTLWGCGPVQRYEQDQTWMLLGMAIRMATDLNLHRRSTAVGPDTPEGRARDREVHNRERTWIFCFCLDRSFSAQMGKPYSIKEDYMIRNASQWARSPEAIPADSALAGYADLQRILTRSLDLLYSGTTNSSGLQVDCDFLLVIKTMETQLLAWHHEWLNVRSVELGENERVRKYRLLIANFYFHYAMLTINAFGLQNALERSAVDIGHFFARCHSSAVSCADILRDEMGPAGYLKYAPDSHFVMGSYAVLSLLKLIRPEFQAFLDHEQKTVAIVNDVANVFEQVAVGPMHTPALYSCFLRALVSARTDPGANGGAVAAAQDHAHAHAEQANGENGAPHEATGAGGAGVAMQQQQHPHAHTHTHPYANGHVGGGAAGAEHQQLLENFAYSGEMGPVADISTFPPTMAPTPNGMDMSMLSMDSILSADFWDSVLVPGSSHSLESLSGGFVYGAGGSGLITPRMWMSPLPSGANTPARGGAAGAGAGEHGHHAHAMQSHSHTHTPAQHDASQAQQQQATGELGLDVAFSTPQGQTEVGVSA
ncbi:fungal-specific transcription factor domain-containing protein [Trametes maxima]|nr:fungal-specific transcription factor domain-containing protein [Trametes maxima]